MKILKEMEHSIIALVLTALFVYFGHPVYGVIFVSTVFITREVTQAEYRWIETWGNWKRDNMPWWGPFDYRVWDLHSFFFNMLLPMLLSIGFVFIIKII